MGKYPKEITVYYKYRNEKGKTRISQAWGMPLQEKTIVVNNEVEEREQLERSEAIKQADAKWREQWRQLREYQYRKNNPELYEPTSGKADSQVTYTRQEEISFLKVILIIGLIGLVIYLFL